jgi:hypothetical protein
MNTEVVTRQPAVLLFTVNKLDVTLDVECILVSVGKLACYTDVVV